MTPQELETLAEQENWNPYYLAYAIETGAKDPQDAFNRDGNGVPFMTWNGQRWRETCKRIGVGEFGRSQYVSDHLETLAARIVFPIQMTLPLYRRQS